MTQLNQLPKSGWRRVPTIVWCLLLGTPFVCLIWAGSPRQTDVILPQGFRGTVRIYLDVPGASQGAWHWANGGWVQTIEISERGRASISSQMAFNRTPLPIVLPQSPPVTLIRFANGQQIPMSTWSDENQDGNGEVKFFLVSSGGPDPEVQGPESRTSYNECFVGTSRDFRNR